MLNFHQPFGCAQIDIPQNRPAKPGPAEIGRAEIGSVEVRFPEIGFDEIGIPLEWRPAD